MNSVVVLFRGKKNQTKSAYTGQTSWITKIQKKKKYVHISHMAPNLTLESQLQIKSSKNLILKEMCKKQSVVVCRFFHENWGCMCVGMCAKVRSRKFSIVLACVVILACINIKKNHLTSFIVTVFLSTCTRYTYTSVKNSQCSTRFLKNKINVKYKYYAYII